MINMKKYIWYLLILLMISREHFCRKSLRRRHGGPSPRRSGRQTTTTFEAPSRCEVKYPGLYDWKNPTLTWKFGSCPGLDQKCKSVLKTLNSDGGDDFENCCLINNRFIIAKFCPPEALCPNRELFPEGTHPQHPENCENYLKLPKHLLPIVNNQTHLIADEDKVSYPRWEKPEEKFSLGTCPGLPYKCHYSQTFEPELCCDPGHFTGKYDLRPGCDCPNQKLFRGHVTYPGFKDPNFKFIPGFCPELDKRCKKSPTFLPTGCCSLEPVVDIEGKTLECQCPNFKLFPSGFVIHSFDESVVRAVEFTTSPDGVQQVTYDKHNLPRTTFPRGSCPGLPQKCRFSTSFDEDTCCDRNVDDEECGCPNDKLFKRHGSYPGYRDPSREFPQGICPGVAAWCKRPENKDFSLSACCGGDCPCPCDKPSDCRNPSLFP